VTTEATRVAIEDMIDAFERGDHKRLADRYDEDVDWRFHAPDGIFPFPAARRGKDDVLAGLVEIYRDYSIVHYKCTLVSVEGERAATMADAKLIHRATGQVITARIGGFHHFRNGKLIAYDGYADDYVAAEKPAGLALHV
jgi:ketosteroid isomerase-like protein